MAKTRGSFVKRTFERNSAKSRPQKLNFGGAICVLYNSHLTVHQCIFKENTATSSGGATYIQKSQILFERCIFEKNKVESPQQQNAFGGVISARGAGTNITIKQCLFKENKATSGGGAIMMVNTRGSFLNCTFERNSVTSRLRKHDFGGAICVLYNSHLTVHQCIFKENTATSSGGATYILKSQILFEKCIFEKNKVESPQQQNAFGGAISATGAGTNITIRQCLFKENKATFRGGTIIMAKTRGSFLKRTSERNSVKSRPQKLDFGGAICALHSSHLTVHQCIFKENTATSSGGATYIQKSQSLFERCIFEKNKVESPQQQNAFGGAICARGAGTNITIKQCLFKENKATSRGGTIIMAKTRGSFVKRTFERNSVKSRSQRLDFGGAICALHSSHLTVHQCIFKENTATSSGGATYIQKSQSLFERCIFEKNKVESPQQQNAFGGAISSTGAGTNITIKQCLFKANKATSGGGAIMMVKTRGSFVNCTFERNSVTSRLRKHDFGGAICVLYNSHLTVHQCIFKENTATSSGGATYILKSQILFEKCIFGKNKVESPQQQNAFGGAISATGAGTNITIKQCLFKENKATSRGGTFLMAKTRGSFVKRTFERNSVKSRPQKLDFGGAICALHSSHTTVQQCIFKENTATSSGGATYIQKSQSLFERCIFEKNKVESPQQKNAFSGAISATGAGTNITIKQCLFKENKATSRGGTIIMAKTRGSFVKCTFERNSVKSRPQKLDFGGAICALHSSHLTVQQCIFKENTATSSGGATYIQKSQSLFESCIFEKNKVESPQQQNAFGGAISSTGAGTNITIKQCLFKENKATSGGGAIMMVKTRGSFVNCTFERNSVTSRIRKHDFGGAICVLYSSHLTVHQCIFKENTATSSGGATYIRKSQSLFESCIFEKNKVESPQQQNAFGGAISATGAGTNITIKQCLFKANKATSGGGAIIMAKTRGSFVKRTFERNFVKSSLRKHGFGGAICVLYNSHLTVHQSIFKENTATYSGGATYIEKSESLFESCIFERNKVISLQLDTFGGAIGANGASTNISIKQCLFKENKAVGSGGAIFVAVSRSLLLKNCTFESNMVRNLTRKKARGGAIFSFDNSDMTVQQCLFKENTAVYSGGAIHMIKTRGSFGNCTFVGNSVKNLQGITFGGAISSENGSCYLMEQCLFNDVMAVT